MQGRNEETIGGVIKGRPRDSFFIASKVSLPQDRTKGLYTEGATTEEFLRRLDTSLKRLGLEYVDILHSHGVSRKESVVYEPVLNGMEKAKKEGKIRFTGISTHMNEPEVIHAATDSKAYDVILTAYNFKQKHYAEVREYNASKIHPQVALPHIPSTVKDVREMGKIEIDQVIIGSCTNGHLDDLRVAAKILKGRKTAPSLRLIIIPATPEIYHQALREGLFEIFLSAGAVISPPTCGPCLGGHMGVLAEGEKALATTNRNFRGRMGHAQSEVYLSSPAVAAASAIRGRICHPEEVLARQ
jgi:aconitase B